LGTKFGSKKLDVGELTGVGAAGDDDRRRLRGEIRVRNGVTGSGGLSRVVVSLLSLVATVERICLGSSERVIAMDRSRGRVSSDETVRVKGA
jgi:hypothetical protein